MEIKFKRLNDLAFAPEYATDGSACMDIRTISGGWVNPEGACLFDTGLSFEVPDGHVMLVFSRSGMGFNADTRLSNCVGVIDSDYRGEIKVKLRSDGEAALHVKPGDRIAQFMIVPCPKFRLIEHDALSDTSRGINGLGSTGN